MHQSVFQFLGCTNTVDPVIKTLGPDTLSSSDLAFNLAARRSEIRTPGSFRLESLQMRLCREKGCTNATCVCVCVLFYERLFFTLLSFYLVLYLLPPLCNNHRRDQVWEIRLANGLPAGIFRGARGSLLKLGWPGRDLRFYYLFFFFLYS